MNFSMLFKSGHRNFARFSRLFRRFLQRSDEIGLVS